ncbi:MAG: TatD family hydrolase, partial [Candidatus Heimdallarchaeota archaeon]
MTLSLDESSLVIDRSEPHIAWGVGCYPRNLEAQQMFDKDHFFDLVERAAIVGEVGLDTNSRVSMELQRQNFRQILEIVTEIPRLVSIHSYRATELVIKELRQKDIKNATPVLHWWTGTADQTQEAVALGCYFSIHSAVARHSKFRTRVPTERILIESDHGYRDPPSAIPCRIEWVEHLVGQQLKLDIKQVRNLVWRNLGSIIRKTGTFELFPKLFTHVLKKVSSDIVP